MFCNYIATLLSLSSIQLSWIPYTGQFSSFLYLVCFFGTIVSGCRTSTPTSTCCNVCHPVVYSSSPLVTFRHLWLWWRMQCQFHICEMLLWPYNMLRCSSTLLSQCPWLCGKYGKSVYSWKLSPKRRTDWEHWFDILYHVYAGWDGETLVFEDVALILNYVTYCSE